MGAMDPNTKLLLDEMDKRFAALDLKWERKFHVLAQAKEEHLVVLENAQEEIISWKPSVDSSMDTLKFDSAAQQAHGVFCVGERCWGPRLAAQAGVGGRAPICRTLHRWPNWAPRRPSLPGSGT